MGSPAITCSTRPVVHVLPASRLSWRRLVCVVTYVENCAISPRTWHRAWYRAVSLRWVQPNAVRILIYCRDYVAVWIVMDGEDEEWEERDEAPTYLAPLVANDRGYNLAYDILSAAERAGVEPSVTAWVGEVVGRALAVVNPQEDQTLIERFQQVEDRGWIAGNS